MLLEKPKKRAPERPQDGPTRAQDRPRLFEKLQEGPRGAQYGCAGPQDSPRRASSDRLEGAGGGGPRHPALRFFRCVGPLRPGQLAQGRFLVPNRFSHGPGAQNRPPGADDRQKPAASMFPLLRLVLGPLWVFWGLSGASWGLPFPLLGRRGRLGSFLGVSRAVFGTSWGHLVWSEAISSVMGPPWGHLGSPGAVLGVYWPLLGLLGPV